MKRKSVIVVGAGVSGLVAARLLCRAGLEVIILEGRDRIGGRISSIKERDMVLEAGPEFIHGRLEQTISLLKNYQIPFVKTEGSWYQADSSGRWSEDEGFDPHWDKMVKRMNALKTDLPFGRFLKEQFAGADFGHLRNMAQRFAEGFDLADTSEASTIALGREWEQEEEEQYRIPGGYGQLTEALAGELKAAGGTILLNRQVRTIQWSAGQVEMTTANEELFRAEKALITLPAGVFNTSRPGAAVINFSPEIPAKQEALKHIGFGTVVKVLLQWNTPFWKKQHPDLQFIISDRQIPTWWTQNPVKSNLLTGWAGGPVADRIGLLSEKQIVEISLDSLAGIFSSPRSALDAELVNAKVFNWKNEIFSGGAYSFTLAGQEQARIDWHEPLENTLYFAGEACYTGPHIGTVEAAIQSGMETAGALLKQAGTA